MSKPELKKEAVFLALQSMGQVTLTELAEELGYSREIVRNRLCQVRAERRAHICSYIRPIKGMGTWIPVYVVGSGDDAVIPSMEVDSWKRIPAPKAPPKSCQEAYEAMPDNPFRTVICQVIA